MWGKIENKKIVKLYRFPEDLRDSSGTLYPKSIFNNDKRLESFYIYPVIHKNSAPINTELYFGITESYEWNESSSKIEKTFNATAREIEDTNAKDEDGKDLKDAVTGEQVIIQGIKTILKNEVKSRQSDFLKTTDKWIIRKADTGEDIPSTVVSYRKEIRSSATSMETAIDKIKSVGDANTLLTAIYEDDKIKTPAVLYNFPSEPANMPR